MPDIVKTWLLPLCTALLATAGSTTAAEAGWVTIKNDTHRVIVVQGTVTTNQQVRRGKPVRLLPGESVREYQNPTTITVEVFDGGTSTKSLYTGRLTIRAENQAFSVANSGGGVVVNAAGPR